MSKKHNNKIIKIDPKNEPLNEKVPKQRENPNSFFDWSPSWSFSRCDFEHEKWSLKLSNIYEEIIQYKNQNVIINFNNYLCEVYIEEIIQDDEQDFIYILGRERGI